MATKECIICGTIMNNVRSDKKYCSRKCQNAAAWKNKNKSRIKICEYCKKEYIPKIKRQKYCCKTCSREGDKKQRRERTKNKSSL